MANVDAPFGLRPIRYKSGKPYNGAANKYIALSSYGTALFIGDPVIKTSDGANTTAVSGHAPGTLPVINKAAATTNTRITGVIVGFEAVDGFDSAVYGAANTTRIVLVADDPELLFEVQDDGGGTLDASTVGLNGNLIFTHSGSTATGRSGVELDGGTSDGPDTTATDQLRIHRLSNKPSNELADNAVWEVSINMHTEAQGVAGI